jgi:hypothetical protein
VAVARRLDVHIRNVLVLQPSGKVADRRQHEVVQPGGEIHQAERGRLGIGFGKELVDGFQVQVFFDPAAAGRTRRRRRVDTHSRPEREAGAEGAHPGELVRVGEDGVNGLRASHREAGDGAVLAAGEDTVVFLDVGDHVGHQAFGKSHRNHRAGGALRRAARARDGRRDVLRGDLVSVAVGHHHDHGPGLALGDEVVEDLGRAAHAGPGVFVAAAAVQQVEHRVTLRAGAVAGWRVDVDTARELERG